MKRAVAKRPDLVAYKYGLRRTPRPISSWPRPTLILMLIFCINRIHFKTIPILVCRVLTRGRWVQH